jgi:acetyl-CoA carboxylase / biotin carboxylase 1
MLLDDYDKLLAKYQGNVDDLPVRVTAIADPNPALGQRYVITDIIGEEPDLGVENLMGSGLIAGATSRAYDQIFTLTIVAGRTVGIGAYLVRLGQRTIQKTRNAPIILTGYQALNKLMGREIYSTNDQLGGPMIMFPNGVSHQLADSHYDSVLKAMHWLSFVPAQKGASLPIRMLHNHSDPIHRLVTYHPPKGVSYDPRYLLTGMANDSRNSGFLDQDSFIEVLSGWAKTVVVGRGRLGGIPIGIIVTENRTSEVLKPADPADSTSTERMVQQAGGVWFPDSAYKTAQALRDFHRESLPCMIFANWRGFSGGQRDMFDEVLKFGSMIVDALVAYQQPLFVYIPPYAELRGGAWVVVDSTINADVMEFYAAEESRGGVLEATGAASIKFRDRDILQAAHRLDQQLQAWDQEIATLKAKLTGDTQSGIDKNQISTTIKELEKCVEKREKLLFGVYQQIAVHFADLHDTPGRMKAKDVIRRQVDWKDSRRFFYYRLKRRLLEFEIIQKIRSANAEESSEVGYRKEMIKKMKEAFVNDESKLSMVDYEDDEAFLQWIVSNQHLVDAFVNKQVAQMMQKNIITSFHALGRLHHAEESRQGQANASLLMKTIKGSLSELSKDERAMLASALAEMM